MTPPVSAAIRDAPGLERSACNSVNLSVLSASSVTLTPLAFGVVLD